LSLLFSALVLFLGLFLDESYLLLISSVSKFWSTISIGITNTYIIEVFNTDDRNLAYRFIYSFSKFISVALPYICVNLYYISEDSTYLLLIFLILNVLSAIAIT